MVSGKHLTKREKAFIADKKDCYSLIHIAEQLGELYPLDNCGHRDRQSVRNFIKELNKKGKKEL